MESSKLDEQIQKVKLKNKLVVMQDRDKELEIVEIVSSEYSEKTGVIARGEGQGNYEQTRQKIITCTDLKTQVDCKTSN